MPHKHAPLGPLPSAKVIPKLQKNAWLKCNTPVSSALNRSHVPGELIPRPVTVNKPNLGRMPHKHVPLGPLPSANVIPKLQKNAWLKCNTPVSSALNRSH